MRSRLAILLLVGSLAAACAGGRVILNVDILSFLENEDVATDYAAPLAPVPTQTQTTVTRPTEVNLVESLGDLTVIESARLLVGVEAENRKGTGTARVYVRLSEDEAGLDDPSALTDSLIVAVAPDSTAVARGIFELEDERRDLFLARQLWIEVELVLDVPAGAVGDSLAGTLRLNELQARVVSNEDFF